MDSDRLASVRPFEICSIRPPTESHSLTFRPIRLVVIDDYLAMVPRERLEYSLRSRLASFTGQYGGLSEEVLEAIAPVVKDNSLDLGAASDAALKQMTAFVKSRLMP